ncbi:DUF6339 family protein [Bacillus luti]|uniref:DUF6339 family protein n=1 Tax=Bacillus luti TaxID=2026191 RepID=UPI001FCCA217|nr:DUF6339 family protein [Bacillus luti]
MKLQFISEDTLQDLRMNFNDYKGVYYQKDDTWFREYFSHEGRVIESNIEFEMPELSFNEDYVISDRENVKLVYSALKHLTYSQATQERLWAGLIHLPFREFAYYRLQNELQEENDNRISTAMFFKHGVKRSLFVHILARLWWVGYMTYDEENQENPFWLTDFFCEKDFSARAIVFFSSNFTSNRNITIGILRAIKYLEQEGCKVKREFFVQANRYLNILGGAMILDMLSAEEVEEMVIKHLVEHLGLEHIKLISV